jgi:pyruvyltransferase
MLTWLAKRKLHYKTSIATVRCWPGGGHLNEIWNWGDAISPTIYKLLTHCDPNVIDYRNYTSEPHLIICGSTLRWVSKTSIVWGAGAIAAEALFMQRGEKPLQVAAVRGPLTRQRFIDAGVPCPKVYGDPALLFSNYYHPAVEPEFELGIIPHYIDQDAPALQHLAKDKRVKILDITQKGVDEKIYSFIDDVARCKRIASSSLHGIILADSYEIPSLWLEFSNKVVGKGFKFHDYFQSVGRTDNAPTQMTDDKPEVGDIIRFIDRKEIRIKFKAHRLLSSFPT